jgi:hypothetical protein
MGMTYREWSRYWGIGRRGEAWMKGSASNLHSKTISPVGFIKMIRSTLKQTLYRFPFRLHPLKRSGFLW